MSADDWDCVIVVVSIIIGTLLLSIQIFGG